MTTTSGGLDAVTIAALPVGANTGLLPVQMTHLLAMMLPGTVLVHWLVRRRSEIKLKGDDAWSR